MKQFIQKTGMIWLALSAMLFSFTKMGGDHFEIWLNNKKVLDQAVYKQEGVKTIQIDQLSANDQLKVYYSHCGVTGKSRAISIRDENNKLLKTWNFPDVAGKSFMACPGKEILGLRKTAKNLLVYYSSKELPEGRLLASMQIGDGKTASR